MYTSLRRPSLFGPMSFYRQALALALPVMAQQLVQSLVSLIDNFMVAGLGDSKMAAVNVANQLNFVFFIVMFTVSGAGGVYMSQYRGAGDKEGMQQAYRFKTIMVLLVASLYFAICQLIPEKMIGIMTIGNSARDEIIQRGAEYLKLVSWFFVPMGLSQVIGSAYREIGQPKIPMVISILATLINTGLNWVFIYGNLGAPRLEIQGAAIATNLARGFELAVFLVWVYRHKPAFHVPFNRILNARWSLFRDILRKSSLMVLSELCWVLSETVIAAIYNSRGGAEVVAGMGAGWAIANIFFLVFTGIHVSTGVIVGGALGADRLDEARQKARWLTGGSVIAGTVLGLLQTLSLLAVPFIFMNLTPAATGITRGLILVISAYLPLWSLLNAQFAVARAGGDMMMGVVVDVGVTYLLFIPGAFALAWLTPWGPVAIFAIVKITDFAKWLVAWLWLRKERWLVNLAKATAE